MNTLIHISYCRQTYIATCIYNELHCKRRTRLAIAHVCVIASIFLNLKLELKTPTIHLILETLRKESFMRCLRHWPVLFFFKFSLLRRSLCFLPSQKILNGDSQDIKFFSLVFFQAIIVFVIGQGCNTTSKTKVLTTWQCYCCCCCFPATFWWRHTVMFSGMGMWYLYTWQAMSKKFNLHFNTLKWKKTGILTKTKFLPFL